MSKNYLATFCLLAIIVNSKAQVKDNYLYNTSMPYGTLDIRTRTSDTNYFYLQENKTFSFRESSPGIRTDTYLDMTSSWDSSPYGEGNLRRRQGSDDTFVMNYRLLPPMNYQASYADGYPLLILFHGGAERANCYFQNCYHATWAYDPNTNNPPAPTTSNHQLLNNDNSLSQGGKTFLDARNRSAGKLPNDPTLNARAFPGFVLVPQMMNSWDSLNVQDAVKLIQLVAEQYNIDENRIYIFGLSIGGYATYEAIKRAPWLFAAAMPVSGVNQASIVKYNLQEKVAHIPLWIFQGGIDKNPTPEYTSQFVNALNNAGATEQLTVYPTLGHTCWNKAFTETSLYSWLLSNNKGNVHPYKGITIIDASQSQFPKLMLAEGFHAYQWEHDGNIITEATGNTCVAITPGVYRARFSRVSSPTATQWNKWSVPITITAVSAGRTISKEHASDMTVGAMDDAFELQIFPNPSENQDLTITARSSEKSIPIRIKLLDSMGKTLHEKIYTHDELIPGIKLSFSGQRTGIYFLMADQGTSSIKRKIIMMQ